MEIKNSGPNWDGREVGEPPFIFSLVPNGPDWTNGFVGIETFPFSLIFPIQYISVILDLVGESRRLDIHVGLPTDLSSWTGWPTAGGDKRPTTAVAGYSYNSRLAAALVWLWPFLVFWLLLGPFLLRWNPTATRNRCNDPATRLTAAHAAPIQTNCEPMAARRNSLIFFCSVFPLWVSTPLSKLKQQRRLGSLTILRQPPKERTEKSNRSDSGIRWPNASLLSHRRRDLGQPGQMSIIEMEELGGQDSRREIRIPTDESTRLNCSNNQRGREEERRVNSIWRW